MNPNGTTDTKKPSMFDKLGAGMKDRMAEMQNSMPTKGSIRR